MGLFPSDEIISYQVFFGRGATGKTVDLIVYDLVPATPTIVFSGTAGIEELPLPRNEGKFQKKLNLPEGSFHFSWRVELAPSLFKFAHEDVIVTPLVAEPAIETQET